MNTLKSLAQIKNYRPKKLNEKAHAELLKSLTKFKINADKTKLNLVYSIPQTDNIDAHMFVLQQMNRIGVIANSMDHHPEWTISKDQL